VIKKTYKEFIKEERGFKDIALGALMGITPLQSTSAKTSAPTSEIQKKPQQVLSTVEGPEIKVKIGKTLNDTDFDLVHAFSGRLQDDFEKRVGNELKRLNALGEKTDVTNIEISTKQEGDYIVTRSKCDIVKSQDGISYTHFTTRGSIGGGFETRHDEQLNKNATGKTLVERLEDLYKGKAKIIHTEIVTFTVNGTKISYKQSFIVASDKEQSNIVPTPSQQQEQVTIKANNFGELRQNLLTQTKNQSIDLNSINLDTKNIQVTYNKGTQPIQNFSLIWDESKESLQNRLSILKEKNLGLQIITIKRIVDQKGQEFYIGLSVIVK